MEILRRPALNTDTLRNTVKEVLDKVKTEGDKAVREYGVQPKQKKQPSTVRNPDKSISQKMVLPITS